MAANKLWRVELSQTKTRELQIEAPDPASRDALAYGLMRAMDEGKPLPPTVTVIDSTVTLWERGNTSEVREP